MTLVLPTFLTGTAAADTLIGGSGTDFLYGLGGNDSLQAGGGDDWIASGTGTNRIDAGDGNDLIVIDPGATNTVSGSIFTPANGVDGGTGYDTMVFTGTASQYHIVNIVGGYLQITDLTTGAQTLAVNVEHLSFADTDIFLTAPPAGMTYGSSAADNLAGTSSAEQIFGLQGNDALAGNGGNDTLDGGTGADRMSGGAGNDRVVLDLSDTQANGGSGLDTLALTAAVTVKLAAADQTSGDAAAVTGFENVDASMLATGVSLTGSSAANQMIGGQGDDILTGGKGADEMAGLGGADIFVFTLTSDSTTSASDRITGFTSGQDVSDLSAIDAVKGGANDAFSFIGDAAFTAAGQLRYDAATGVLEGDVTGDGVADIRVILTDQAALTVSDLVL